MRCFIGFKYKTGGTNPEERQVPVMYGDLTRQAAQIIKENSENKLSTVPKIACYISALEMDQARQGDYSFVGKLNLRERSYELNDEGERVYNNYVGGGYTIERLMPVPYKIRFKADIWTSSTDQKLQLLEQILIMFTPSLEIQTTDNYVDWTSLSIIQLTGVNWSSRVIPQGSESEIDICTLDFETPIYLTAPTKVKKLGIVKNIVANIFGESGQLLDLENLIYDDMVSNADTDQATVTLRIQKGGFRILLLKNAATGMYDCTILDSAQAMTTLGLEAPTKNYATKIDWFKVLELYGGYTATSKIYFLQPSGYELVGTFSINEVDPSYLVVDLDIDTIPSNTLPAITAIIDPYKFNPLKKFGSVANIPAGTKYLMLDDVNPSPNRGQYLDPDKWSGDSALSNFYDGPDAWKDLAGNDLRIKANSIIEWNGSTWITTFDPDENENVQYVSNLTTGIQYKWDGTQWLRSFEGEYSEGYWRFDLDA
jgi:hypothetical protein